MDGYSQMGIGPDMANMTPTPDDLRTLIVRYGLAAMIAEGDADLGYAMADAWDDDKARARLFKSERDAAEAQVDRIANGIAVLGEENAALRKRLEEAEEWIKVSALVAQVHAFCGIEDESWRDVDWTQELPSGQYDIWQTFDEETKQRLAALAGEE